MDAGGYRWTGFGWNNENTRNDTLLFIFGTLIQRSLTPLLGPTGCYMSHPSGVNFRESTSKTHPCFVQTKDNAPKDMDSPGLGSLKSVRHLARVRDRAEPVSGDGRPRSTAGSVKIPRSVRTYVENSLVKMGCDTLAPACLFRQLSRGPFGSGASPPSPLGGLLRYLAA